MTSRSAPPTGRGSSKPSTRASAGTSAAVARRAELPAGPRVAAGPVAAEDAGAAVEGDRCVQILGGIGIGNRGTYDLGCFLEQKDVQFAAVCDIKEGRRLAVKKQVDGLYGNQSCLMFRDYRELLDRSTATASANLQTTPPQ